MEDWDLLAVVRGHKFNNNNNNNNMESQIFSTTSNNNNNMELLSSTSCFVGPYQDQDNLLFNTYPHLFEPTTAFDELEELYKPFYPGPTAAATVVTRAASSSSLSSTSSSAISSFNSLPKQVDTQQQASPITNKPRIAKEPATKYKKRKNQQKRVVKEVREDGLSLDMWAWRKYGQKPIKGSPYPRSYYRCSSSKGCSARKQVERNPTNPEIFIITYTAEHTHAHPTRRNSLAGSTRCKFPNGSGPKPEKIIANNSEFCSSKDDIDDDDRMNNDHEELVLDNGDSASSEIDMKLNVVLGHNNDHQMMFASLDDLERGIEELDHEETSNNNNIDDDKSELLDSGFFDDEPFLDANWFVDQYNTTVTGAC